MDTAFGRSIHVFLKKVEVADFRVTPKENLFAVKEFCAVKRVFN